MRTHSGYKKFQKCVGGKNWWIRHLKIAQESTVIIRKIIKHYAQTADKKWRKSFFNMSKKVKTHFLADLIVHNRKSNFTLSNHFFSKWVPTVYLCLVLRKVYSQFLHCRRRWILNYLNYVLLFLAAAIFRSSQDTKLHLLKAKKKYFF